MDLLAQIAMMFREPIPLFAEARQRQSAALGRITEFSGKVALTDFAENPFSVRLCSAAEAIREGWSWERSWDPYRMRDHVVVLETAVSLDEALVAEQARDASIDLVTWIRIRLSTDLQKLAGDLVLAASIAVPGALEPTEIQCSIDGKVESTLRLSPTSIEEARQEAAQRGWPPLTDLPLEMCLRWLQRIPGFSEGVPRGSLGRAVAAMSRLLGFDRPGYAALMWCMIGLEALYAQGKKGLSDQLFEKAKVLLGAPQTHKKAFRGLYDYRSRFIHGDLDFPLAYTPYDAADAFMDSVLSNYERERLATALLIGTLQAMVSSGRMDLQFRWELASPQPESGF